MTKRTHKAGAKRLVPTRGERGFTIVEVIVALTLTGAVVFAVTGVFYSGLRTTAVSSNRSTAAALATRETEAIHGVDYANVGFYSGELGYVPTFEGGTTVTLGSGNPTPADTLRPSGTETIGPITYTITRHLTWADALDRSGATLEKAYKKTTVIVDWTDRVGPHTVRQDSVFYPGGQGPYIGPAGSSTTTSTTPPAPPGRPTGLTAVTPAAPDGYDRVNLSWTAPSGGTAVNHYRIEASLNSTFSGALLNGTTTATTYTMNGLANNTQYWFRVYAVSTVSPDETGSSTASVPASATTLNPPPAGVCVVYSMALSSPVDGGVNRKNNGDLDEDITVVLSVNADCSATTFAARAELTASTGPGTGVMNPSAAAGVNPKTFSGTGTTRTVTWARNSGGWASGDHTIVLVNAGGTPVTPSRFVTVLVCNFGVSPC